MDIRGVTVSHKKTKKTYTVVSCSKKEIKLFNEYSKQSKDVAFDEIYKEYEITYW